MTHLMAATAVNANDLGTLGVPGLIAVILVLASVIIYLVRKNDSLQTKYDNMQEQRIADAKEVGQLITGPLEKLANQQQSMYDYLINRKGK